MPRKRRYQSVSGWGAGEFYPWKNVSASASLGATAAMAAVSVPILRPGATLGGTAAASATASMSRVAVVTLAGTASITSSLISTLFVIAQTIAGMSTVAGTSAVTKYISDVLSGTAQAAGTAIQTLASSVLFGAYHTFHDALVSAIRYASGSPGAQSSLSGNGTQSQVPIAALGARPSLLGSGGPQYALIASFSMIADFTSRVVSIPKEYPVFLVRSGIAVTGIQSLKISGSISGRAALSGLGKITTAATRAVGVTASFLAQGVRFLTDTTSVAGQATVAGNGGATVPVSRTLSATAAISASSLASRLVSLTLSSVAQLVGSPLATMREAATQGATAALSGVFTMTARSLVTLYSISNWSFVETAAQRSVAVLANTALLQGVGHQTSLSVQTLAARAALVAVSIQTGVVSRVFGGTSALASSQGRSTQRPSAVFAVTDAMASSTLTLLRVSKSIDVTAAFTFTVSQVSYVSRTMAGTASVAASALAARVAAAGLTARGAISSPGDMITRAIAYTMAATASLSVVAERTLRGSVSLGVVGFCAHSVTAIIREAQSLLVVTGSVAGAVARISAGISDMASVAGITAVSSVVARELYTMTVQSAVSFTTIATVSEAKTFAVQATLAGQSFLARIVPLRERSLKELNKIVRRLKEYRR